MADTRETYTLSFRADTSDAKKQIGDLKKSLEDIVKLPANKGEFFDDKKIQEASKAALELQQHLNKALNVNTGKLDLSKFSSSLKASNKDLTQYYNTLLKVGPQGEQAFLNIAKAISTADAPVTRLNKRLVDFGATLKRTATWQISSNIIHGVEGAIKSAYGYAQNLNESLTNIQIVTGHNNEYMAKFADEANRAAKALSTTTTAYTDAALIFYQQGLADNQVKERTDLTIKMAQVTGDSATDVSSYMTAIWNNFDDGSQSLEHYTDVITALGAATASSSAEISEGIAKFAAVAETAGLSYEYATSALATVVATTRQSADTVGTAFKTLFARIQDLELGKTLEDGTDLGQYSLALQKIGVSIKDTSGNLRDMDSILDDLGARWGNLSKDVQIATAQAVAGTRQYTQLVALMDNWDFFQKNLDVANNSEGTLQEQADIYAKSWEAAQKRVRAAMEGVYNELVDADFFISMSNGIEKIVESIQGLIKGFGGMNGMITTFGSLFMSYYATKMPQALENLKLNLMVLTGQSTKVMADIQNKTNEKVQEVKNDPNKSFGTKVQAEGIQQINGMQQKLLANSKNLTEEDKARYKYQMDLVSSMNEQAEILARQVDEEETSLDLMERRIKRQALLNQADVNKEDAKQRQKLQSNVNEVQNAVNYNEAYIQTMEDEGDIESAVAARNELAALIPQLEEAKKALNDFDVSVAETSQNTQSNFEKLAESVGTKFSGMKEELNNSIKGLNDGGVINTGVLGKGIDTAIKQMKELSLAAAEVAEKQNTLRGRADTWSKQASEIGKSSTAVKEMKQSMSDTIDEYVRFAQEKGITVKDEEIAKLKQEIEECGDDAQKAAQKFNEWATQTDMGPLNNELISIYELIEQFKNVLTDMGVDTSKLTEIENKITSISEKKASVNRIMQEGAKAADQEATATFHASEAFVRFGSAMTSAYSLMNSFKNAVKVFTDESATGFEKLGAAVSLLSTAMMTMNTVSQFASTLGKLDVATKIAQTTATGTLTGATGLLTKIQLGLNAAIKASPMVTATITIAAFTAAIWAAGKAVSWLVDAFKVETIEEKIDKARKSAENFKTASENAANKANEIRDNFDKFTEVQTALNECAKGTEAWKEQLATVNQTVSDILDKSPDMAKYFNLKNGQWEFDKDIYDADMAEQDRISRAARLSGSKTSFEAESLNSNNENINITSDIINKFGETVELYDAVLSEEILKGERGLRNIIENAPLFSEEALFKDAISSSDLINADEISQKAGQMIFDSLSESIIEAINSGDIENIETLLKNNGLDYDLSAITSTTSKIIERTVEKSLTQATSEFQNAYPNQFNNLSDEELLNGVIQYMKNQGYSYNANGAFSRLEKISADSLGVKNGASISDIIINGVNLTYDEVANKLGDSFDSIFEDSKLAQILHDNRINFNGTNQSFDINNQEYQERYDKMIIGVVKEALDATELASDEFYDKFLNIAPTIYEKYTQKAINDLNEQNLNKDSILQTPEYKAAFEKMIKNELPELEEINWDKINFDGDKITIDDTDFESNITEFIDFLADYNFIEQSNIEGLAGTLVSSMATIANSGEAGKGFVNVMTQDVGELTGKDFFETFTKNVPVIKPGQSSYINSEDDGLIINSGTTTTTTTTTTQAKKYFDNVNDFASYLKDTLGGEEELKAYLEANQTNITDLYKIYKEQYEKYEEANKEIKAQVDELELSKNSLLNNEDFTINQRQEVLNKYNDANNLSANGAANLDKQFNSILSGYDSIEDRQAALSILLNQDFSNYNFGEVMAAQFEAAGLEIDLTDDKWVNFIETMQKTYHSIPSFDNITNKFYELNKVLNSIDKDDATISLKDFTAIKDILPPDLADQFQQIDDKTVQFIGDLKDIENIDLISALTSQMNEYKNVVDKVGNDVKEKILNLNTSQENVGIDASTLQNLAAEDSGLMSAISSVSDYTNADLGNLNEEQIRALISALQELFNGNYDDTVLREAMAATAQSIQELEDIASGDIELFNRFFDSVFKREVKTEGFDVDVIKAYSGELYNTIKAHGKYDDAVELTADEEKELTQASQSLALAMAKQERGVNTITKNWDNWTKSLAENKKGTYEYNKTLKEITDATDDLLNTDLAKSFGSQAEAAKFVAENLDLINKAATEGGDALQELQKAATLEQIEINIGINKENWDAALQEAWTEVENLDMDEIEIGTSLDTVPAMDAFTNLMEQMLASGQMTEEQIQSAFNQLGWDPEITWDTFSLADADTAQSETTGYVEFPNIHATEDGIEAGEPVRVPLTTYQAAMESGATTITIPRINGKKTAPSPSIGTNTQTGRRGGGGGGGGRGSRGRATRRAETKKANSDEIERYHVVNKQLDDITKQLNRISKAKDRAFGKAKLKLMDEEIKKQGELIEKQKEYVKQVKEAIEEDKQNLKNGKAYYHDENGKEIELDAGIETKLGMQIEYDENGSIKNWKEIREKMIEQYNKEVEGKAADSEDVKKADAWYEQMKKYLEQYEETQDKLEEETQNLIDQQNDLFDLKLAEIEYEVELNVKVNDQGLKVLDFMLKNIQDDAYKSAEAIELITKKMSRTASEWDAQKKGLEDIFSNHGLDGKDIIQKMMNGEDVTNLIGDDFTQEEVDFIIKSEDELINYANTMKEFMQQIFDAITAVFDKSNETFDKSLKRMEHMQNVSNSLNNIINLTGRGNLGISSDMMRNFNNMRIDQAQDVLRTSKEKYDLDAKELADARLQLSKATSEQEKKHWQEVVDHMQEATDQAYEDYLSAWEEALQVQRDMYDANLDLMMEDFSESMGGLAGNLAGLREAFDQATMLEEDYVPEYERVYELTKLTRDITNAIDETGNIRAKQELAALQDEINQKMEAGEELSEYDLDYLRKRFELKQAEIALEEAQNAKSQVTMTRDAEGNYGYVYTADSSAVENAQQTYEDKLYQMQQANAEYINTLQQSMLDLQDEMQDKIRGLADIYEIGSEDYNRALAKLQETYQQQFEYYNSQMGNVLENNKTLYENDVANYAAMTDNRAMLNEKYISSFEQTKLAIAGGFTSMTEYQETWNAAVEELYGKTAQAAADYQTTTQETWNLAGEDMDEFADTFKDRTDDIKQQTDTIADEISDKVKEMEDAWKGVNAAYVEFAQNFDDTIINMVNHTEDLTKALQALLEKWSDVKAEDEKRNQGEDNKDNPNKQEGIDNPSGPQQDQKEEEPKEDPKGNQLTSGVIKGVAAAIWMRGADVSGWGNNPQRSKRFREKFGDKGAQIQSYINRHAENGDIYREWASKVGQLSKYFYSKFDTGGYTGNWSGEGRFAMLHQKELVLNKADTENMLSAVNLVRQIASVIDINALTASGGLGAFMASTINTANQGLEQNVHITAEFPNATDRNEILSAFDNVINLASQYANRKL